MDSGIFKKEKKNKRETRRAEQQEFEWKLERA